jgi:probable H4MPT-linked C1 transfer pathway protein
MPPAILGLDVGGANLKAATPGGDARSVPFPLWKRPADLPDALRALADSFPAADQFAVTMTGELCDCFPAKRDGVLAILDAVAGAAGDRPVAVWCNDGRFVPAAEARRRPLAAAAANWLALATFAGRYAPAGPALLLDVGSTTADLVPLLDGRPVPRGHTDPERLLSRELVYTGVRRTPLCALAGGSVAAELFATTLDAYLVLGEVPDDPSDTDTADGRPGTRAAAHARLARMLGADLETSTEDERLALARRAAAVQTARLVDALERVAGRLPAPPRTAVLSGSGEFLAARVLAASSAAGCATVSLREKLGQGVSAAACAYAVAVLRAEELKQGGPGA